MQQLLPVTKIRFPKATPLAKARGIVFVEKNLAAAVVCARERQCRNGRRPRHPLKLDRRMALFAGLVAAVLGLGEGDLDGIFHA